MPAALKLFILSFLTLFLELTLIRFIPAHIRLVGYFNNLILLASFLGIGLGFLRPTTKSLIFFPLILICLQIFILLFRIEVSVQNSEVIFFNTIAAPNSNTRLVEPQIILPIIFLLTAFTFFPLSQALAAIFSRFQPLTAYALDITGALVGIGLFSLMSALGLNPFFWFLVIGLLFIFILPKFHLFPLALVAGFIAIPAFTNGVSVWSPYYKITAVDLKWGIGIDVNHINHQVITDYRNRETFYFAPYQSVDNPQYQTILIIGSGVGTDAAVALGEHPQVKSIDAVEIDPRLANFGQLLNPNHPYADPRVHLHITDGRQFLQNSSKRYDLIIYALPDSLVLTGRSGQIRLESYLFTRESFELAKNHLTANGLFVLYNYYRQPWLIDKISASLTTVFGYPPHIVTYKNDINNGSAILIGPQTTGTNSSPSLPLATDDWPFLYLKTRSIPAFYLKFLVLILGLSFAAVMLIRPQKSTHFSPRFFFLGAGFMLLETKSLVTFSLLFGTTWLVNSLVFAAILAFILLAIGVNHRSPLPNLRPLYFMLFAVLATNFFLPPSFFLTFPQIPRYLLASLFYFTPLFLANLIFAGLFRRSKSSTTDFASNLLGALLGGICEYISLITGYRALTLLVATFYTLSLFSKRN